MYKRKFTELSDFKCMECDRCFASRQRLMSHQRSVNACQKIRVPDSLQCPCGHVWSQKTSASIQCWRSHQRHYAAFGFCVSYVHCRKCAQNIRFNNPGPGSHVCDECTRLDIKVKTQHNYHPILTASFDNQEYETILGTHYCHKPQIVRKDDRIHISDDAYRGFEYFSPTVVGSHEDSTDPCLSTYKSNMLPFCQHSDVWKAIKVHSRHCLMKKYTEYTSRTPMLKEPADCLYWLYLSPQSHIMPEYPSFERRTDNVESKKEAMRLTSDDKWHSTESYRRLKKYLPEGSIPLSGRNFGPRPGIIDSALSFTGPIRVVHLSSRWENDRKKRITHETQAETTFYFMMKYVARTRRWVSSFIIR